MMMTMMMLQAIVRRVGANSEPSDSCWPDGRREPAERAVRVSRQHRVRRLRWVSGRCAVRPTHRQRRVCPVGHTGRRRRSVLVHLRQNALRRPTTIAEVNNRKKQRYNNVYPLESRPHQII